MATVSTTSILGSDSISASRITINSNFLLLENWINGYTQALKDTEYVDGKSRIHKEETSAE